MKREIKFRAWDSKFNVMIPDVVVYDNDNIAVPDVTVNAIYGDRIDERLDDIDSPGPEWYLITNNLDVMEFTGLKDINGIEIYEGDIVKYIALSRFDEQESEIIHAVEYVEYGFVPFVWHTEVEDGFYDYKVTKVEVLGNIHQNSELLNP